MIFDFNAIERFVAWYKQYMVETVKKLFNHFLDNFFVFVIAQNEQYSLSMKNVNAWKGRE